MFMYPRTGKDFGPRRRINASVLFDDVVICAGDLVVGDCDGVVCVARIVATFVMRLIAIGVILSAIDRNHTLQSTAELLEQR